MSVRQDGISQNIRVRQSFAEPIEARPIADTQPLNPVATKTAEHTDGVAKSSIEDIGKTDKELKADGKTDSSSLQGRVKSFGAGVLSFLSHPLTSIKEGWNNLPPVVRAAVIITIIAVGLVGVIGLSMAPGGQVPLVAIGVLMFVLVLGTAGGLGLATSGMFGSVKPEIDKQKKAEGKDKPDEKVGTPETITPDKKIKLDQIKDWPTALQQISLRKDDIGKLHDNLSDLEKDLNRKDTELKQAKKELEELESIADTADPSTHDPLILAAQQKVETLKKQKAEIKSEIKKKLGEINTAKKELQPFITQRNQIHKEIISLKKQASSIEDALDKDYTHNAQDRKVDSYLMSPNARIADLTKKNNDLDKTKPDYSITSTRLEKEIQLAKLNEKIENLTGNTTPKNKNELFKEIEKTKSQIRQREIVIKHLESASKTLLEGSIQPLNDKLLAMRIAAHPEDFNDDRTPKLVDTKGDAIVHDEVITPEISALLVELEGHNEDLKIYGDTLENQKQLLTEFQKTLDNLQIINDGIGKRIGDLEVQRSSVEDQLRAMYGSKNFDQLTEEYNLQLQELDINAEDRNPQEIENEKEKINQSLSNLRSIKENAIPLELKLASLNDQLKGLKGTELVQAAKIYKPVVGHLEPSSSQIPIGAVKMANIGKPIVAELENIEAELISLSSEDELNSEIETLQNEYSKLEEELLQLYEEKLNIEDDLMTMEMDKPTPDAQLLELRNNPIKKNARELMSAENQFEQKIRTYDSKYNSLESKEAEYTANIKVLEEKMIDIKNNIASKNTQLLDVKAENNKKMIDEILAEVDKLPSKVPKEVQREPDELDILLSSLNTSNDTPTTAEAVDDFLKESGF